MLYSQSKSTGSVVKLWKVLVAALSIILVWHYLNTQAFATDNDVIAAETIELEIPQEPTPEELYAQASFLDIVPSGNDFRYSKKDLFCMAKNIYHESRGEPTLGKYAVAQVTMNRVRNSQFSNTVCGVVFEPRQFSWANNRNIRWTTPSGPAWNESMKIAQEVLDDGATIKGMENALFFHSTQVRPGWKNMRKVTRIGAHIFYKRA
jgi:spore germination cell wall hydrolase CwlJ-like protein